MTSIYRSLAILALRAAMIVVLIGAGWLIYKRLPVSPSEINPGSDNTTLQIVLGQPADISPSNLDIAVEFSPVDIVAVGHEYFTERRPGKRWDDFLKERILKERMKGRPQITGRLDKQGRGTVVLPPGDWWLHATLSGDEDFEWRLRVNATGGNQVVELTPQNAYTRAKTF